MTKKRSKSSDESSETSDSVQLNGSAINAWEEPAADGDDASDELVDELEGDELSLLDGEAEYEDDEDDADDEDAAASDDDEGDSEVVGSGRKRPVRRHTAEEDESILAFAIEAARLCNDRHATEILLIDVREVSSICDYILIATGTSDRQIMSIAAELEDVARERGMSRMGGESDPPAKWVVIDFVDILVHLFEPATRAFYDLEMLWGDGQEVAWRR